MLEFANHFLVPSPSAKRKLSTRFNVNVNAVVGTATFTFKTASTATLSYTINGVAGTKEIEREIFAAPTGLPNLGANDLWWNGLNENGWGMNIAQQGRQLFPVWYTCDANGKNTFYAVPGGTWNGLTFTGDIYTTTSSAWLGVPYEASKFAVTKVGTMTIDFRDDDLHSQQRDADEVDYAAGGLAQYGARMHKKWNYHFERSEKSAFSSRYKKQVSHPMKPGSK